MFCPQCGTRNPDGARFCASCGTNLGDRSAAPCEPESPVPPTAAPIIAPPAGTAAQPVTAPTGAPLPNQNPSPQISTASGVARLRVRLPQTISAAVLLLCFFMPIMSASFFGATFSFSPADLTFGKQVLGFTLPSNIMCILFAVPGAASLIVLFALKEKPADIICIVLGVIMFAFIFLLFRSMSSNAYAGAGMGIGFYLSAIASFALVATSARALIKAGGTRG